MANFGEMERNRLSVFCEFLGGRARCRIGREIFEIGRVLFYARLNGFTRWAEFGRVFFVFGRVLFYAPFE